MPVTEPALWPVSRASKRLHWHYHTNHTVVNSIIVGIADIVAAATAVAVAAAAAARHAVLQPAGTGLSNTPSMFWR